MSKKILLPLGILLILVSIAVYLLWPREEEDPYANTEYTHFAVKNAPEVLGRIFLADRMGNQALFERQSDGSWLYTNKVTGKTFLPAASAFNNLIKTLEDIRVRNKVQKESIASVTRGIATIGIKVELYNRKNKLIRTYYIGGPADGGRATFAITEGSDLPRVVYVENFQGTIDTRYTAKEINLRDKAFVRIPNKDIESIQVEYFDPLQRPYSFKIDTKSKPAKVTPLYADAPANAQTKQEHVQIYLSEFQSVAGEAFIYEPEVRDSILRTVPFAKISLKTKKEAQEKNIALYPLINPSFDRGDGKPGLRQRINRYYVDAGEDFFMLGQDLIIQKLLRPYDFFLEKEKN